MPFLLSFVLLGVGMFVRLKVSESPIFKAALEQEEAEQAAVGTAARREIPLLEVLRRPKTLIFTMLAGAAGFALQVVLATFSVTYAVSKGADRAGRALRLRGGLGRLHPLRGAGRPALRQLGRRPVMVGGLVLFIALPRSRCSSCCPPTTSR